MVWVFSLLAAVVMLLAPLPALPGFVMALTNRWRLDLCLHVILFAWLMLVPHGAEWGRRRRVALSMGLTVMAMVVEAAQGMAWGRTLDLRDAMANLGGIWLGAWVGRRWSLGGDGMSGMRDRRGRGGIGSRMG
jgi:VanZ family protein